MNKKEIEEQFFAVLNSPQQKKKKTEKRTMTREEELLQTINRLEEQVNNSNKEISASIQLFKKQELELEIARKAVEEREGIITGLSSEVAKKKERIKSLSDEIKVQKELLKTKEQETLIVQNNETSLVNQLGVCKEQLKNSKSSVEIERNQNKLISKEVRDLTIRYGQLENDYNSKVRIVSEQNQHLEILKQKNDLLEDEVRKLENKETNDLSQLMFAHNKEKEEWAKVIKTKEGIIEKVNQELKDTRKNNRYLKELVDKLGKREEGNALEWYSNRDTFLEIVNDNLSPKRVEEELGDIRGGWLGEESFQFFSKSDQKKIDDYDKLELHDLPKDWKKKLKKAEKIIKLIENHSNIPSIEETIRMYQSLVEETNRLITDSEKYSKEENVKTLKETIQTLQKEKENILKSFKELERNKQIIIDSKVRDIGEYEVRVTKLHEVLVERGKWIDWLLEKFGKVRYDDVELKDWRLEDQKAQIEMLFAKNNDSKPPFWTPKEMLLEIERLKK